MREKVKEKNEIISRYEQNQQLAKVSQQLTGRNEYIEDTKIEYISQGNSSICDREGQERYISQL